MKYQFDLREADFSVGRVDIQNISRPKGYKHSFRNGRIKHGFIYTVKGCMLDHFHSGEKKEILVEEGEIIFIPRGSSYTGIYQEDGTEIKIIQFELISGSLPPYLSRPTKISLSDGGKIIDSFFTPTENQRSSHPFYYLSRLYELLWRIDESLAGIPAKYKRLRPALDRLQTHWNRGESVAFYASLCLMSEAHFRRLFREYTGLSPVDYRNDLRLKNARAMLQSGEYNVSTASEASGFSNLSFFIRLYKKKYGHTPKKE